MDSHTTSWSSFSDALRGAFRVPPIPPAPIVNLEESPDDEEDVEEDPNEDPMDDEDGTRAIEDLVRAPAV